MAYINLFIKYWYFLINNGFGKFAKAIFGKLIAIFGNFKLNGIFKG